MYSRVQPPGKVDGMNSVEIEAVKNFVETYNGNFNPLRIAKVLRKSCIIDDQVVVDINHMQKRRKPQRIMCEAIINATIKSCSLERLIQTLYENDFKEIAGKLFVCYLICQDKRCVHRVNRADTSNRRKIGEYFKHIKELVHERAFKNAYLDVHRLGKNMETLIRLESTSEKKMHLCDKFVALKAAQMDALANMTGRVIKNHQVFIDIEKYKTSTSNPAISQIMLLGRQADALSTIGEYEQAENLIKDALVSADTCVSCIEVTDLLYRNVIVNLSKFERFPYDEELKKSILYEADRGLWSLQEVQEDLRLFWTKLFLLRMAFVHLGIGKFCHMIKHYIPTIESVTEAERILKLEVLRHLEHRRKMFMSVAKARLNQWKGHMGSALCDLKEARQLAKEGKYVEDEALQQYELFLKTDPWENTRRHNNIEVRFSFNSIELFDSVPALSLSSFEQSVEDIRDEHADHSQISYDNRIYNLPPTSPSTAWVLDPSSFSGTRSTAIEKCENLFLKTAQDTELTESIQMGQDHDQIYDSPDHLHLSSILNT